MLEGMLRDMAAAFEKDCDGIGSNDDAAADGPCMGMGMFAMGMCCMGTGA